MLIPSIFTNDLLDNFFMDNYKPTENYVSSAKQKYLMSTDIKEFDDHYDILTDLPGFEKENVKATLKEGYLTIEASKSDASSADSDVAYVHKERFTGTCNRSFFVGKRITQEDLHAAYSNGVLTISVPKVKELPANEQSQYITIE